MRWAIMAASMAMAVPAFGEDDTEEIKPLSVEQATELVATTKGDLFLDRGTILTPETAEILARHDGALYLREVDVLTPELAEALAKHSGEINFEVSTLTKEEL